MSPATFDDLFEAIDDPQLRAAVASELVSRLQFGRLAGLTFDGKRDFYQIFGYKDQLTVTDYRQRYERGGVAGTIVDCFPKATWRGGVELVEDEKTSEVSTEFEVQCKSLFDRLKVTSILQSLDILSRLSTFAVLLIGDGDDVTQPLRKGNGPDGILFLTPFCGNGAPGVGTRRTFSEAMEGLGTADAVVETLEQDRTSPRFGLPTGYRLRRTDFDSADDLSQKIVHWTRIIHVCENPLDDQIYGEPALRRPWNDLDNLEKVLGGGAEAFFQRANQGRLWNIDKDVQGLTEPDRQKLRDQIEKFQHNITRDVFSRGVDVKALGSDVANFNSPADACWTALAGTTRIPKRILTGSEMGELASSQDRDNFRDQINGRRETHAGPNILRRLIDRLIEFGYLATPKQYQARWGSVLNLTQEERRAKALGWANTNVAQKNAGLKPVYLSDEIRDQCDEMEPYDPKKLEEEMAIVAPPEPTIVPGLRAAEEAMVERLAEAIEAEDTAMIEELLRG